MAGSSALVVIASGDVISMLASLLFWLLLLPLVASVYADVTEPTSNSSVGTLLVGAIVVAMATSDDSDDDGSVTL